LDKNSCLFSHKYFFAWALITRTKTSSEITRIFLAFISTCLIALANYVINEWLNADSDKFRSEKNRSIVSKKNLKTKYIIPEYIIFSLAWDIGIYQLVCRKIPSFSPSLRKVLFLVIGWEAQF
jgi:heme O synthase-like polyprenyltransferase